MPKTDFKKTLKQLYSPPTDSFVFVEVPTMNYLMIDGHGDPNTVREYTNALETLYPVAYALKFLSKSRNHDYVVPPLEGLWWADDLSSFVTRNKDEWDWTMMIMTPDWISRSDYDEAIRTLGVKRKNLPAIDKLRLQELSEGSCAQIMHIGSYDSEAPTLAHLHDEWLPENGLVEIGKHHEIYISDPRKTAADRLKTVLRQPVRSRSQ